MFSLNTGQLSWPDYYKVKPWMFISLSDNDIGSYKTFKENLLKRFRLTDGGYRKHFKQSKIENGETPEQFIERLRRYLQKWCHMAGFEQTYEGLEDLILSDQFFIMCDKPLQTFLKEKGEDDP